MRRGWFVARMADHFDEVADQTLMQLEPSNDPNDVTIHYVGSAPFA